MKDKVFALTVGLASASMLGAAFLPGCGGGDDGGGAAAEQAALAAQLQQQAAAAQAQAAQQVAAANQQAAAAQAQAAQAAAQAQAASAQAQAATAQAAAAGTPALDLNGDPNVGRHGLRSGFTPDPFPYRLTAGGGANPVDLSVRPTGGCSRGYVTSRPDFRFDFEAGTSFNFLRFFVVTGNDADALLLINKPDGSYVCNDDHGHSDWGNTLMPAIDFESPQAGRYDIWVGTYERSSNNPAKLFITELQGKHPGNTSY